MQKHHVIITGATGMVGEGALMVCLNDPTIEKVLIINRRPSGIQHAKLQELIHADLENLSTIESYLSGYDTCLFCLGISSIGISKEDYYKTTYNLTLGFANTLSRLNPDMCFCYISGAGTDSSEKGFSSWARVKGKTENDLMKLPFKQVYAVRPGFIKPLAEQKRVHKLYYYVDWMFPIGRRIFPGGFCRIEELTHAMLRVSEISQTDKVLEGRDIIRLAAERLQN